MEELKSESILDQSPGEPAVRGVLHLGEASPGHGLVLTHGAGSNCNSPLLIAMAEALSAGGGITVLRCDLPFRQVRPHGLPLGSADRDQAGLRRAVETLRRQVSGRILLGGHSYGGRMASMLAAREPSLVTGLLLLSYPLHPPRKLQQMRTSHFPDLRTRALFIHGARDPFGSLAEMDSALRLIPAQTRLVSIANAGHELLTKANRESLLATVTAEFKSEFL